MKSKPGVGKKRLDVLLLERGLADSRQKAQGLLLAGRVLVNGQMRDKPGVLVSEEAEISVTGSSLRYAGRGGLKLEGALEDFRLSPENKVCLDVGASTGGFTDCLLQQGARSVYAVDVNTSQLAWKLQRDPRVVRVERNARHLRFEDLSEPVEFVTVDVSFISVGKVLPAVVRATKPGAEFLILVKPQFELERANIGPGGIVRDPRLQERAIESVRTAAAKCGLAVVAVRPSRLSGAEGNQEFFLHAVRLPPNHL